MKILIINKFLHPNGGSETYIFQLGAVLKAHGHEVQYFGMEHEGRCVGNEVSSYTSDMDFHGGGRLAKLTYPVKTVYSSEARKKLRPVLDSMRPDVCHLNNFNYQLTPSIILEIREWEHQTGHPVRIVYTAHDYQLICPNHMLRSPLTDQNCENCLHGHFLSCMQGRCIHGSFAKSAVGAAEAYFWKARGVYRQIDTLICPTHFMKSRLDSNPVFAKKTVVLQNFAEPVLHQNHQKKPYVLYFGRFSKEKGIKTLISVCRMLPEVHFIFAGSGPLSEEIASLPNAENVGFQTGEALQTLIAQARFSVYPSEWYENCPYSVMESQMYGTPVLGADIGGIPELIADGRTGELFESGNVDSLKNKIETLWYNRALTDEYSKNCREAHFLTAEQYYDRIMAIYQVRQEEQGE